MQKRTSPLRIIQHPIGLDPRLPVFGGQPSTQADRPIDYLHVHECLELGYCHSGHGIFMVGEKILPYATGDAIFITPAEPHLARSAPGTRSEWSWLYADPARLCSPAESDPAWPDLASLAGADFGNVFTPREHPEIVAAVRRLADESLRRPPGHALVLRALVTEIVVRVRRARPPARRSAHLSHPADYERLAPALQALARDHTKPVRIPALATRCRLGEAHFRRLFRRVFGVGPLAYVHDLRLRTAASLLRATELPVLTISLEVGFESLSSFNRLFRARLGVSPREWRRGAEAPGF